MANLYLKRPPLILKYEDLRLFGSRLVLAFLSIVQVQFLKYLVVIIVVTILNNLQISSIFVAFEIYSDKAKLTLHFTQA